jgi:hypothetical protein
MQTQARQGRAQFVTIQLLRAPAWADGPER